MITRTNSFADMFYKVRDKIDSYTDADMNNALLYRKIGTGKSRRDVTVTFDWGNNLAFYKSFDDPVTSIPVLEGSFDPLSIFYALRYFELEEGKTIEVPISDGKKSVVGKAEVIRREPIEAGGVIYDTYLVEPELEHISGVFRKSRNAKLQIWVTVDERHMPVLIKSRVIVGSFSVELISHN